MRELLSCAAARRLDERAKAYAEGDWLIERAATRMWDALVRACPEAGRGRRLTVVCGRGNNGADAASVALCALFEGRGNIRIVCLPGHHGNPCARRLERIAAFGVECREWRGEAHETADSIRNAEVVVDGITGSGLDERARDADLIACVNGNEGAFVVSIDLPSGAYEGMKADDPIVRASLTLTVAPLKTVLFAPAVRAAAGSIVPVEGVFPAALSETADAHLVDGNDAKGFLPAVPASTHKNARGSLAVFAGGKGSTGAAAIACRNAFAAGLATLYTDAEVYAVAAASLEGTIVSFDRFPADFSRHTAVLAGCGWFPDRNADTYDRILESGLPCVLDAGAVDLARMKGRFPARCVLTPHPGEFERLTGTARNEFMGSPRAALVDCARATGAVVALKAHVTWIASPDGRVRIYDGMVPELATGGSGDALAGLVGGLLAAGMDPFDAATGGVVVHGEAGRLAARAEGWFDAGRLSAYAARFMASCRQEVRSW